MTTFGGRTRLDGDVRAFAQNWFDLLSDHKPVELLLRLIADDGLEMVFPERTLHGHADFVEWYAVVGHSFVDQSHEIERLDTRAGDEGIDVEVGVIWRATEASGGRHIAVRANQKWLLTRDAHSGEMIITRYRVLDMTDI